MKVVRAYVSEFPDPLRLVVGQAVRLEERATQWPGWLWCIQAAGPSGWVPAAHVRRDGSTGVALREYDATELTVNPGDVLQALEEESGWARCRAADGAVGWVPLECVELCE